jgi:hypothetical protein
MKRSLPSDSEHDVTGASIISLIVIKQNDIQVNNLIPYYQNSIFVSMLLSCG